MPMDARTIDQIIKDGTFVVTADQTYQSGEMIEDDGLPVSSQDKWDFPLEKWPGQNKSPEYRSLAERLLMAADNQNVPYRLAVSEMLRAVDCRITEFLYSFGLYPKP